MSFIKSIFKGFLILVFLPFYWLYAIVWFIVFRGKLNGYPRVKKDATAKHIILAVISIFTFSVFASELSDTSTQEANKDIVLRDTYMESVESVEDETDLAQEDTYSSLIDDTAEQATAETDGYKTSINYNTDYELSLEETSDYETSASISPYYKLPVDEVTDYESSTDKDYNYEPSVDEVSDYESTVVENTRTYILNTSTMKIHIPDCPSIDVMNESNKKEVTETIDVLKNQGYEPCGRCKP